MSSFPSNKQRALAFLVIASITLLFLDVHSTSTNNNLHYIRNDNKTIAKNTTKNLDEHSTSTNNNLHYIRNDNKTIAKNTTKNLDEHSTSTNNNLHYIRNDNKTISMITTKIIVRPPQPRRAGKLLPSDPMLVHISDLSKCPFDSSNVNLTSDGARNATGISIKPLSMVQIEPHRLPGYSGYYRSPSALLPHYEVIYAGQANTAPITRTSDTNNSSNPSYKYIGDCNGLNQTNLSQFRATISSDDSASGDYVVIIHCRIEECIDTNPYFYVRGHGPSIIAGEVNRVMMSCSTSSVNGLNNRIGYVIKLPFRFEGRYTVEIVLEVDHMIPITNFPFGLSTDQQLPPAFQGWMLPSFPLGVDVVLEKEATKHQYPKYARSSHKSSQWCNMTQLSAVDPSSQWVATHDVTQEYKVTATQQREQYTDFQSFTRGYSKLGICTEFVQDDCSIIPTEMIVKDYGSSDDEFQDILSSCMSHYNDNKKRKKLNIIMFGDSVTRSNINFLSQYLRLGIGYGTEDVYVTDLGELFDGVIKTHAYLRDELNKLLVRDENRVLIFNAGLHDIADTCYQTVEYQLSVAAPFPSNFTSCLEAYQAGFLTYVRIISAFLADLKIFRTTNAAWLRWGQINVDFGLSPQPTIPSHNTVKLFNDAAISIIRNCNECQDIRILDFYWPTLSRPDNTEINGGNKIGAHMVHPGFDTVLLLLRKEIMMIMHHFCEDYLHQMR